MKRCLACLLALLTLSLPGTGVSAAPIDCGTADDDRCERWAVVLEEDAGFRSSFPVEVLEHPSGSTVFATGYARSGSDPFEANARGWVAAVDAATGSSLRRTDLSPGPYLTLADSAMDPRGDFVAVVGKVSNGFVGPPGMYLAAVSTADGSVLWEHLLPQNSVGRQVEIAPDGSVVATGFRQGDEGRTLVGLAIRPDGDEQWRFEWQGPGGDDVPEGLALTPDGRQAILTVASRGAGSEFDEDIATLAIALNPGHHARVMWEARYDFTGVGAQDAPRGIALSPDGKTVYVTGYSNAATAGPPYPVDYDAVTLAYEAKRGDLLWTSRYRPPDATFAPPRALVATADRVVMVLAAPEVGASGRDIATVALDASKGTISWTALVSTPRHDSEHPDAVAVSPDGSTIVVTGGSSSSDTRNLYAGQGQNGDQLTVAYDATQGSRLWIARYRASDVDRDTGRAVTVGNEGAVYTVTTLHRNIDFDRDFDDVAVIAY